jgi:tetratricopeptide (TPR) repeat protein
MNMRKTLLLILITLVLIVPLVNVQADEAALDYFTQGNEKYKQDDFSGAIELYEQALAEGQNGEIYFNLGNAWLKEGSLGRAMLNYRRAQSWLGSDDDLMTNIELIQKSAIDERVVPDTGIIYKSSAWFYNLFSLNQTTILAIMIYWLVMICIILIILLPFSGLGRISRVGLWILVPLLILLTLSLSMKIYSDRTNTPAVVVTETADVLLEPKDGADMLYEIHDGYELNVLIRDTDWSKVNLGPGQIGWMKNEAYEII